ncbi:dephospho-CoA kinase [Planctomicrobium sp. SH661]|uniref:dephospho-CoA kinase n=1 Tax=Planctomicrobium sp. SH661 TaxID=3448124 RepID=UPI003F5C2FF8
MSAARIPVIGIVGGIGSGKSALANALMHHFQCGRLDADSAGHRALARPDVIAALKTAFGPEIFDEHGNVVRSKLAQRVFGAESEQLAARKQLESIVHPHIRRDIVEQLEGHQSRMDCDIILLDAALLIEAGWSNDCDAVIYVDVPDAVRQARVASRGWSPAELARRESSQLSLKEKQARSDLIVKNTGDIEAAATTAANWIRQRFHLVNEAEAEPASRER